MSGWQGCWQVQVPGCLYSHVSCSWCLSIRPFESFKHKLWFKPHGSRTTIPQYSEADPACLLSCCCYCAGQQTLAIEHGAPCHVAGRRPTSRDAAEAAATVRGRRSKHGFTAARTACLQNPSAGCCRRWLRQHTLRHAGQGTRTGCSSSTVPIVGGPLAACCS